MATAVPDFSEFDHLSQQDLLELLPVAAYAVRAPDGVIVWYNQRAAELWGRKPQIGDLDERFCGSHRLYLPDGTYMAHDRTPIVAALENGTPLHKQDVIIERPDGSRVTVCVHIDPVRDSAGEIIGVVNFFYDVTERKIRETKIENYSQELEIAVQQRTAAMTELSHRLIRAQDEERRRISRDLHDGVGQHLAVAKISIGALVKAVAADPTLSALAQEALARLETATSETRTVSYLLHPPLLDELGFAAAIRIYAEGFNNRGRFNVQIDVPDDLPRLPEQVETALFRIVQESMTNIHRHSGASKARISLTISDGGLRLEVADNGRGFDPEKLQSPGVGLASIRERVHELHGSLEIQEGNGSRLIATVPVNLQAARQASP